MRIRAMPSVRQRGNASPQGECSVAKRPCGFSDASSPPLILRPVIGNGPGDSGVILFTAPPGRRNTAAPRGPVFEGLTRRCALQRTSIWCLQRNWTTTPNWRPQGGRDEMLARPGGAALLVGSWATSQHHRHCLPRCHRLTRPDRQADRAPALSSRFPLPLLHLGNRYGA